MTQALRKHVRVQPGGRVEFQDDALPEGAEAEVIVLLAETAGDGAGAIALSEQESQDSLTFAELEALPPLPLDQIIGAAPSGRSVEEIDRDLRSLRDEWD